MPSYWDTLTAAVADLTRHGYDSAARVDYWAEQIRLTAEGSLKTMAEIERMVRDAMAAVYRKQVDNAGVVKLNPGVSVFDVERLKPALRADLDRRVAASLDLIRLNRPQAIAKAQQRFRGWATSIPPGGAENIAKLKTKQDIRKSLARLPFEERRVIIDQSAKLFSSINATVAENSGAIAAVWHSHKNQRGYDGRPQHNARDGKIFLVRDSWAATGGLVRLGPEGYTDQIEQPAELPFCRCFYQYLFSLRSLPAEMLTRKGEDTLRAARAKLAAQSQE